MGLGGNVIDIAGSLGSVCAVKSTGALWCWGTLAPLSTGVGAPAEVIASGVTDVSLMSGTSFGLACAVVSGGVQCVGGNSFGQIGNNSMASDFATFQNVTGLTNVIQVATMRDAACALKNDGTVWCWGDNSNNLLGNAAAGAESRVPVSVDGITDAIQMTSSDLNVCILRF